jgi:DNA excision repair protein ERCC-2
MGFIRTSENYDDRYVTYLEKEKDDFKIKLFCLDPSHLLSEASKRGSSSIFFSATLTPLDYFKDILGGDEDSYSLRLASPFPEENLCLLVNDKISTRYSMREQTYDRVAEAIAQTVKGKTGNYLVFFPSYKYLSRVLERFIPKAAGVKAIFQKPGMSEAEREEFLSEFSDPGDETLVGFAVMGGVFGEGIDLTGELLSGAIIVGVGLPQICLEREIISDYFNEAKGLGFEFAYMFPGMNKVMQAAGRVIRTVSDRGVVLLIDERFSYPAYKRLFPTEWSHAKKFYPKESVSKIIDDFWNSKTS